jgi:hypothetical protein
MAYSFGKTLSKGATPVAVVIAAKAVAEIAKANGIPVDDATVMAAMVSVYGVITGLRNWLKNKGAK